MTPKLDETQKDETQNEPKQNLEAKSKNEIKPALKSKPDLKSKPAGLETKPDLKSTPDLGSKLVHKLKSVSKPVTPTRKRGRPPKHSSFGAKRQKIEM